MCRCQGTVLTPSRATRRSPSRPDQRLAWGRSRPIEWVTDLAEIPGRYGVANVYGELGATFANSCVTHPRYCAALLGTLV